MLICLTAIGGAQAASYKRTAKRASGQLAQQ